MVTTRILLGLILVLASASIAACGEEEGDPDIPFRCADEPRGQVYEPGMIASGNDSVFDVTLMEMTPAPPDKGAAAWTIELRTRAGVQVPDANIKVKPFMPDHGHGTAILPEIAPGTAAGQYQLDPVMLGMPGLWEIHIDATADGATDRITFSFCVEG